MPPGRDRSQADWSGRRDLNPRPSPWQGDALPLSYSRWVLFEYIGRVCSGQRSAGPSIDVGFHSELCWLPLASELYIEIRCSSSQPGRIPSPSRNSIKDDAASWLEVRSRMPSMTLPFFFDLDLRGFLLLKERCDACSRRTQRSSGHAGSQIRPPFRARLHSKWKSLSRVTCPRISPDGKIAVWTFT